MDLFVEDVEEKPTLEVKPFGAHGVRLHWSYSGNGPLVAEAEKGGWVTFAECDAGGKGVLIVKEKGAQSWPWRVRSPTAVSAVAALAARPKALRPTTPVETLGTDAEAVELAFNVLQWYSTVLVDMRSGGAPLLESLLRPAVAELSALPWRDDALVIGELSAEGLGILQCRVARRRCQDVSWGRRAAQRAWA